MSLIPYHPREGREIVLRHRNAVVVRDTTSNRLEVRGSTCPTCHQPLGQANPSPNHSFDEAYDMEEDSYVAPEYFRMLGRGNHSLESEQPPSSPVRRLTKPTTEYPESEASPSLEQRTSHAYVSDPYAEPVHSPGSRIKREAFSPNYFKTFFVEERVLGQGGKGVVLLVRHEIDGCQLGHFACKRVPVGDDHSWLEKVLVEVELLAKLSHPNLVSYRHVWLEDVQLSKFGPNVVCAFILQQYCNSGDLHQYVVGHVPTESTKEELKAKMRRRSKGQPELPRNLADSIAQLSFDEIYSLFKDITSGVAYLHSANYVHRDLKPSNCLLHRESGKLTCLISDFGEVQRKDMMRNSTGSTGTISYCAPEVLRMDAIGRYGNFTTKSDMFSLGMILYFMCFGRLPYQSANAIQEELEDIELLRAEITDWKGFRDERRERPDLPSRLYAMLKKLLALNPNERPSANEVLTAMKSETSFDGITRSERNTSPQRSLRGGRVNIDSLTSGASVTESRDHRLQTRRMLRDEPSPNLHNGAMHDHEPIVSTSGEENQIAISQRDSSFREIPELSRVDHRLSLNEAATPLLLPPPQTFFGEVRHRLKMVVFHTSSWLWVSRGVLAYIVRLSSFFLKLATLVRPCWPYVPRLEVSLPLLTLATLDLMKAPPRAYIARATLSSISSVGLSLVTLLLHFLVLWLAQRWNTLCVTVHHDDWVEW